MIQLLLAEDPVYAMKLGGQLLDKPELNVEVVSDAKGLLVRLNNAPNFYHAVVMRDDLPEISLDECITFIKRVHSRVCVLVLLDDVEKERIEALGQLGIRSKHVMGRDEDPGKISAWIDYTLGEEGLGE